MLNFVCETVSCYLHNLCETDEMADDYAVDYGDYLTENNVVDDYYVLNAQILRRRMLQVLRGKTEN